MNTKDMDLSPWKDWIEEPEPNTITNSDALDCFELGYIGYRNGISQKECPYGMYDRTDHSKFKKHKESIRKNYWLTGYYCAKNQEQQGRHALREWEE